MGFTSIVNGNEVVAANKSSFTDLCMVALSGNRAAMHNRIKFSGYSKAFVRNHVQCNKANLLSFIAKHGKNSKAMVRMLDNKN